MPDRFAADRFTCAECGRDRARLADPLAAGLCFDCIVHPGWFREPEMRAVLAPDHDGREVAELGVPLLGRGW